MKITTLPILLLLLLGVVQEPRGGKVDLGEEFKIKNGQEIVVRGEKLRIRFRSVPTDSRCPSDVTCVWAGNGEVALEVARKNKKQVVVTLNTLSEPKEIVHKGFKIRLLALNPYPKASAPIDPKDYEATLLVIRLD